MKKILAIILTVILFSGCEIKFFEEVSKEGEATEEKMDEQKDVSEDTKNEDEKTEVANPASVNCSDKGGELEMRKNLDGNEYGVCVFEDNRQCEEWALFYGNCPEGGVKITGYENEGQIECAVKGGEVDMENSMCTLPDDTKLVIKKDGIDYDTKESEKAEMSDEIKSVVEKIEKSSKDLTFDKREGEFAWRTADDESEIVEGIVLKTEAESELFDFNLYSNIMKEAGYEIDIYNAADGGGTSLEGYKKGDTVCTVLISNDTSFDEKTEEIISSEITDIEISCGDLKETKDVDDEEKDTEEFTFNSNLRHKDGFGQEIYYLTDDDFGDYMTIAKKDSLLNQAEIDAAQGGLGVRWTTVEEYKQEFEKAFAELEMMVRSSNPIEVRGETAAKGFTPFQLNKGSFWIADIKELEVDVLGADYARAFLTTHGQDIDDIFYVDVFILAGDKAVLISGKTSNQTKNGNDAIEEYYSDILDAEYEKLGCNNHSWQCVIEKDPDFETIPFIEDYYKKVANDEVIVQNAKDKLEELLKNFGIN